MQNRTIINSFQDLQAAVSKGLTIVCNDIRNRWFTMAFFFACFQVLSTVVFVLFLINVASFQTSLGKNLFVMVMEGRETGPPKLWVNLIFGFIWLVFTFVPLSVASMLPFLQPYLEKIKLSHAIAVYPLSLSILSLRINQFDGKSMNFVLLVTGFFLIFGFITAIIALFYIVVIHSSLPSLLVVLFANPSPFTRSAFFPGHDQIVAEVVGKVYLLVRDWSRYRVKRIIERAKNKSESISFQVETVSPLLGAFSLIGLVAVLFSQDQIRAFLLHLSKISEEWFGSGIGISFEISVLVILAVLIYGSAIFFIRAYWALRVSEIIVSLCEMRLEEIEETELLYELLSK